MKHPARSLPSRILALAALAGLVSCGDPTDDPNSVAPAAGEPPALFGWQALPASTLSPRTNAHAFWTGWTVLVIGGVDDISCPPSADCVDRDPPLRDGAAFNPETNSWTELPDAPVPLGHLTGGIVGGTLYVWVPGFEMGAESAFLSYTPGDEGWVELALPPFGPDSFMSLVAAGDRLVAYQDTHELGAARDLSYDPSADRWTELPADPLTPAFDRQMAWTDGALVLLARELIPNPGSEEPSLVVAARLELQHGTWERLPDSKMIGTPWAWTGDRLVNAAIGSADGGQVNNWGRPYPYGGILKPATGEWSKLPATPNRPRGFSGFSAAGGGWAISTDGWALHVPSSTWVELRRPAAGVASEGQAAIWAGDRLVVFGGSRVINERFMLVDGGWSWLPGEGPAP